MVTWSSVLLTVVLIVGCVNTPIALSSTFVFRSMTFTFVRLRRCSGGLRGRRLREICVASVINWFTTSRFFWRGASTKTVTVHSHTPQIIFLAVLWTLRGCYVDRGGWGLIIANFAIGRYGTIAQTLIYRVCKPNT